MAFFQPRWRELLIQAVVGGMGAGLVFAVSQAVIAVLLGLPVLSPVRLIGSVALGPAAMSPAYPMVLSWLGFLAVQLSLSAVFGIGLVIALSLVVRGRPGLPLVLVSGMAYGGAIWFVTSLAIIPLVWPQFVVIDQVWQGLVPHALFYGLPLAVYLVLVRPSGGEVDYPR